MQAARTFLAAILTLIMGAGAAAQERAASRPGSGPATRPISRPAEAASTRPAASRPARPPAEPPPPLREGISSCDIHDATEAGAQGPLAIAITGTRNGAFSGKVVVGSSGAIEGLQASVTDLKNGEAAIPAAGIQVRYGVPWDLSIGSFQRPKGADMLLESPPATVAADRGATRASVWVTVTVPKDAKVGAYTGTLTVQAKGLPAAKVPVTLRVQDWALPDTHDWRTWIELIQSPDNLAAEYNLPYWSDKHWDMIGRSLKLIGLAGSRVVYVPLIARTNLGHDQSYVRWIKKGENQYEYDFSLVDKYLDTAQKNMGTPKLVIFFVWDVYLNPPSDDSMAKMKERARPGNTGELGLMQARVDLRGKGPPVTVLDPATGKTETVYLPRYSDPASKALWQPVYAELRKKMQARGLEKAMLLGVISDWEPTKEDAAFLKDVSGGMPWASCTHHTESLPIAGSAGRGGLGEVASVVYVSAALEFSVTINPAKERTYGWKNPVLFGQFWRNQYYNYHSHSTVRHEAECNITGKQRGLAHMGGDYWYAIRDKGGTKRLGSVSARWPETYWHSLNIHNWFLAPGADGPVGTVRLELLREGVQECEARIYLEAALTDPAQKAKLGEELASRAQQLLDDQQRNLWRAKGATDEDFAKYGHVPSYRTYDYDIMPKWNEDAGNRWFIASGWQDRVAKLYATAAEAAGKLK